MTLLSREGSETHREAVVEDLDAVVQLHVLADALVQRLHDVRRAPEELRRVQHCAQQVHCCPLDEHLAGCMITVTTSFSSHALLQCYHTNTIIEALQAAIKASKQLIQHCNEILETAVDA